MEELADFVNARLDELHSMWCRIDRAAAAATRNPVTRPVIGFVQRRLTRAGLVPLAGLAVLGLEDVRVKRLMMDDHARGRRTMPDGEVVTACTVCDRTQWDADGNCQTARHLAEPFRGHPDYGSWRPGPPLRMR
jgi:hypothetical protein